MTLKELRQNVQSERAIAKELLTLTSFREKRVGEEREVIDKKVNSLINQLRMINNAMPALLNNISPVRKMVDEPAAEVKGIVNVQYEQDNTKKSVTISEADRRRFMEEIEMSNISMKRRKKEVSVVENEFKKPSPYAKTSNRFFSDLSNRLIAEGHFQKLGVDLRKANMPFILNTYVSMVFFTTLLSCLFSAVLFIFLIFFRFSPDLPFIFAALPTLNRLLVNLAVCVLIPVIVFFAVYLYPSSEKHAIKRKIDVELPFATMHMSAIAGSGIEPSQIFKIIALGREYKYTKQELKKVINQVNIYGYDLVSALKNSARNTSSAKLAELLNGMATTISSGGSLTDFLDKRTETLLFDYKLDREKSTKSAETFMDIYISIVIAAPMIMMLLMVLISVSGIGLGLTLEALTIIIISVVALINFVFLVLLQTRQQGY